MPRLKCTSLVVSWVGVHHLGLFPIDDMQLMSCMLYNCRLGQVPACKCSPVLFQSMIQRPTGLANIHLGTRDAGDPVDHTRPLCSGMRSFRFTSVRRRVRCGRKQVQICSGERIRRIDLDTCRTYGMTTVALSVTGSDAGLHANGACQFLLTTLVGYPLLLRAWVMCLFSASLSGTDM